MLGRVIVLVTALLVATAGVLLVWLYTQRSVADARAELDPVVVLAVDEEPVPAGTTVRAAIEGGTIVQIDRPRDALPPGYVPPDVGADVLDLETSSMLYPGEVLIEARLQDPEEADGLKNKIGDQQLAITLPLADPNRVARFLEPGDVVAVFVTRQGGQGGAAADEAPTTAATQLLVPEVTVIAVGSRTTPGEVPVPGEEVDGSLVTVSVLQADAERLILAQSLGELYLGLLTEGEGESAVARSGGTSSGSLFEVTP